MRLAAAKGEIALARGDWEAAVRAADDAIAQGRRRGRVKYHALGLEIRAKALAALGREWEGIGQLRQAVALVRPTGDPLLFLRAAAALLTLDGDDTLLAEAGAARERIALALLEGEVRTRFLAVAPAHVGPPRTRG
jgi:hypothetical protein